MARKKSGFDFEKDVVLCVHFPNTPHPKQLVWVSGCAGESGKQPERAVGRAGRRLGRGILPRGGPRWWRRGHGTRKKGVVGETEGREGWGHSEF